MKGFTFNVKTFISSFLIIILAFITAGNAERGIKDPVDANEVRIMSFNIRYSEFVKRIGAVPKQIGEYMPDSVGLQECTYDWYNTLQVLLPEYEIVGLGRDTGDISENCGEMSAILYRADKYKLVDSGHFWISETPEKVSKGWDAGSYRICTWVILENLETCKQYAHVNCHLDNAGAVARAQGSQLVAQKALSFDIPTVLTGDFNFSKGCDEYNAVTALGLKDTQDIATETMSGRTYHDYKGGTSGKPIDYVFVNSKITSVSKYQIIRDKINYFYVSDHYPIYADMVIE